MAEFINSPYYSTEEERNEMVKEIANFSFDDIDEIPKSLFILISGLENTGKTHLACSVSKTTPVYFLDTEMRGHIVATKFKKTNNIFYKQVRTYKEIVVGVQNIIHHKKPPGIVLIDSGSDFQQFAEEDWKFEAKKLKVYPQTNWAYIYEKMDKVIYDLRAEGFTIIITSRMKKEYKGDSWTGSYEPRIYNRAPYNADIHILLDKEKEDDEYISLLKNGFTGNKDFVFKKGTDLTTILIKLMEE